MKAGMLRSSKPRGSRSSARPRRAGATRRLLAVAEEEMQRIILDLHDGPVQDMFAALSQLTSLRGRLPPGDPALVVVSRAISLLESSQRGIRGMLITLRAPALAERKLPELLVEPAIEHEALTGAAVKLDLGVAPALALRVKIGLYRILQEALSNVRRHAEVATASVRLRTRNGRVILEITDQGRGFDPPPLIGPLATDRPEHIGLRGMRERAALMNGSLRITSRPGRGTRVRVEVPVDG